MPNTCVVGLQWGDEAKGKIVDVLSDEHDVAVRYNGGPNAGHTVVWGDRTFKLSLLPTGVLRPHLTSVIGNGVVVYPPKLLDEIDQLVKAGVEVGDNLKISDRAHVIFPYHLEEEKIGEAGSGAIGTTGRGIGPCYQDKVGRVFAVRVGELLRPDHLRERLRQIVPHKNRLLAAFPPPGEPPARLDADKICDDYLQYAGRLRPFVCDTVSLVHGAIDAGKSLLIEAAQGSLLDVDHGTYPYVTSSHSLPGGIWNGSGVPARKVGRIIGIAKAYTSRVGRGPFPTELHGELADRIREAGREYGTVTGRPRRVGWFDAAAVRYTARLADADEVALMLLDVLTGVPELKVATSYSSNGEALNSYPPDSHRLESCEPSYETLPGWGDDITAARSWGDLPANARRYVERVEEMVGLRVSVVSVGPDREQTIRR